MAQPIAPSPADRALVAALAAWSGVEALPLLRRFGKRRARELAGALAPSPPADPIGDLRAARSAQFGPDPARVHPSWYVRALQDESPAVRRVVIGSTAGPLRSDLLRGLGIDPADLAADHPDDPEARRVALALWTERLVGDDPPRLDDPPAIAALATLGPVGLYRLARLCGLAKRAILPETAAGDSRALVVARLGSFRRVLAGPFDPRLVQIAANDRDAAEAEGRHRLAALGLVTLGRLLARGEPHRVRWALQHVPYPVAKRLRLAASRPQASVRQVLDLERRVLDAALARLADEGRATPDIDPPGNPDA